VPLGDAFARDIAAGTLPMFSFVTPDLCDDTHDCGIGTGDAWLAEWLSQLLNGPQYRDGRTAVFVVWDEPTPMAELVIAPSVVPGTVVSARTDHYALLRTTEELLGLPFLGRATGAVDLRPLYHL
jgi:phospholipase C